LQRLILATNDLKEISAVFSSPNAGQTSASMPLLDCDPAIGEIQHLVALLPIDWRSRIAVVHADQSTHLPIVTQISESNQFSIQINFQQWQHFTMSQQDLLFWHAVARLQGRSVKRSRWEILVMLLGLTAASVELPSHSVLAVAVALVVAGLAGYRLYQSHRGEQHMRKITAADQGAIDLAMQFGYSFNKAHSSLYEALHHLAKQPGLKAQRRQYQRRLRVLEILASRRYKHVGQIAFATITH
jgi:Flp pilus assembly protein TadB